MDGSQEQIINDLFEYAREIMDKHRIFPYVAFVVRDGHIIARGHNMATTNELLYAGDITRQGDVTAIRNAQQELQTGDLANCTLYSFIEPTLLGFDVGLWAGIKHFVWCVNKPSVPTHFTNIPYRPLDYARKNPEIRIENGLRETEALELVKLAEERNYYPLSQQS